MKTCLLLFAVLWPCFMLAGQTAFTTARAHSHNDYEQAQPFWAAWRAGFGSIEADVFLEDDQLLVGHDKRQILRKWRLDSLYLLPLQQCIANNNGSVYADSSRSLQLMIDLKTDATATLQRLVDMLKQFPSLTQCSSLQLVISGNRPAPEHYFDYPGWILFDGRFDLNYTSAQLARVPMFSDNFGKYSKWNGKGRLPEAERQQLEQLVKKAHQYGKKVRFWNAPDILNSWYQYLKLDFDYINTDDIDGIRLFFQQMPDRSFSVNSPHELYQPQYRNDGDNKPVKNFILLIGDGTGLAQWYAGYTANKGGLNVFNMRFTGLSKTSSYDNYITDSAPGATAFSSGKKTNNRAVGVGPDGESLTLITDLVKRKGLRTGIISSGDFRDATPASFYAHQSERSNFAGIMNDLAKSNLDLIMGHCDFAGHDSIKHILSKKFSIAGSIAEQGKHMQLPALLADTMAAKSMLQGRGNWLQNAFSQAVDLLSNQRDGFFLMLESAQIDHGGHANRLPYLVSELLDFDRVIGDAMAFADRNGETLVVVIADHETGGLSLTGGDYSTGTTLGQFSTTDHTAIPVPVFAYGPQARLFGGVYENTGVFEKMLLALKLQ